MSGMALNMDDLEISPIEIDQVSLSNFSSDFEYQKGSLKNTKMKFEVEVRLNWKISFRIKFLGETIFSVNKSDSLDLFKFNTGFVDVDTVEVSPGKMNIDIPKLALKFKAYDLRIAPAEKDKIVADSMKLSNIMMEETSVPTSSPALFGATIPLQNPFGPQKASIDNTTIDEFEATKIILPPFELHNLHMDNIVVEKVLSDDFSVKAHTTKNSDEFNLLGIVKLWATIDVKTTMQADEMEFNDLTGNIVSDKTSMSGMTMDFRLKDIQIKNIKLEGFDAKELDVGL
jgi:hypothetical protein